MDGFECDVRGPGGRIPKGFERGSEERKWGGCHRRSGIIIMWNYLVDLYGVWRRVRWRFLGVLTSWHILFDKFTKIGNLKVFEICFFFEKYNLSIQQNNPRFLSANSIFKIIIIVMNINLKWKWILHKFLTEK